MSIEKWRIEAGTGLGIADAYRKLGITEQTYYRWKKEYGGLRVEQAKRLKGLEQENARLNGSSSISPSTIIS